MSTHKRFDSDDDEATTATTPELPAPKTLISKPQPRHLRKGRQQRSLRGQIRSVERLIRNRGSQLVPAALSKKKLELAELVRLRDEHDRREKERSIAKEYRMLKFFERRKLQRVLDKIVQHGDKPEDKERKQQVLRDLRYIDEYPRDKKYVALFPTGGHSEKSRAKVEAIRAKVEGRTLSEQPQEGMKQTGEMEDSPVADGEAEVTEQKDDFFLEE